MGIDYLDLAVNSGTSTTSTDSSHHCDSLQSSLDDVKASSLHAARACSGGCTSREATSTDAEEVDELYEQLLRRRAEVDLQQAAANQRIRGIRAELECGVTSALATLKRDQAFLKKGKLPPGYITVRDHTALFHLYEKYVRALPMGCVVPTVRAWAECVLERELPEDFGAIGSRLTPVTPCLAHHVHAHTCVHAKWWEPPCPICVKRMRNLLNRPKGKVKKRTKLSAREKLQLKNDEAVHVLEHLRRGEPFPRWYERSDALFEQGLAHTFRNKRTAPRLWQKGKRQQSLGWKKPNSRYWGDMC